MTAGGRARVPEFPLVALPREVERLRAQVREFLAAELAGGGFVARCDAWLAGWDPTFSRKLGEQGWLGMSFPRRYGGHERSALERYAVIEELLAAGAPVAAHWIADRQIGPSLLRHGSEEQRKRFLPAIASGQWYVAIGMSEPDSGSDLASVRTKAERTAGGWRLTGRKVWTSGAHHAHAIVVLARNSPAGEDRHAGLSQFIVELPTPGVDIRPVRLLTGEHHFNEVVFDEVFVGDEMVLGAVGEGWRQVTAELAFERSGPERFLSTFPLLLSLVEELRELRERRGGAPEVGALVARLWALRAMSLSVAGMLAAGSTPAVQAALVKDLGTRYEKEIVEAARALVAVEPDPAAPADTLSRRLADAVLHAPGFTLRGGTNEILRTIVAREMVGR